MLNTEHVRKVSQSADRKRLQIEHALYLSERAKLVKLADKICNVRDMASSPPATWPLSRRQEYLEWAKQVVDGVRGSHPGLERAFDETYRNLPSEGSQRGPTPEQMKRSAAINKGLGKELADNLNQNVKAGLLTS